MGDMSLTLVRRLKAPPAKVFAAFTRPEMMMRWWGPDAGPVLLAEADLRIGGAFRVLFRTLGGLDCDCRGVYREIEPDRRLVFTWRWEGRDDPETLVTVALRPIAEGTELTFTHARFQDDALYDSHEKGWTGALSKLSTLMEETDATA